MSIKSTSTLIQQTFQFKSDLEKNGDGALEMKLNTEL